MTLPSDRSPPEPAEISAWIATFRTDNQDLIARYRAGETEIGIAGLVSGQTARRFYMLPPQDITRIADAILYRECPQ